MMRKILVLDIPTRLGHWLLAGGFVMAWLTGDSESLRYVHAFCGGMVISVMSYRLPWHLIDPRRRARFIRKPQATLGYFMSLAILTLLLLGLLTGITGWMAYQNQGDEWLGELHEMVGNVMIVAVGVHLGAVITLSVAHQQNLFYLMITGRKIYPVTDQAPISREARPFAALVLLTWAVLGAWWISR